MPTEPLSLPPDFKEFLQFLNSTQIDGVVFAECYQRRLMTVLDGIGVPVIGLEDLLTNKRASNRLKDQADVESLTQ